jgi:hypothetical protein
MFSQSARSFPPNTLLVLIGKKGEEFCNNITSLEVYQYHNSFLKICQLLQGAS